MNSNNYTITGGPLRDHEYVEIKREMTARDDADIQNAAAQMGGAKKDRKVELTIGNIKIAALKVMIVSWNLTRTINSPVDGSPQEVPIPFTEEEIEKLPRRVSAYINHVINELNPEEDYEDFLPTAAAPSGGSSAKKK